MPKTSETARRRRYDPDRRERLKRAAAEVIADLGVGALSHRAVAERADVPLGSTTYHYATLDDLLLAGLEEVAAEEKRVLNEWADRWDMSTQLIDALVELVTLYSGERREATKVEYELHVAALRRPSMREASLQWDEALYELLARGAGAAEARLLIVLMDGLLLSALARDAEIDPAAARAAFERLLGAA